jgi:drug/metabolite transporter (DMT)-like permease
MQYLKGKTKIMRSNLYSCRERVVKLRDVLLLFLLGAIWGASFSLIRVIVPALGPFVLAGTRAALAGLALLLYARIVGEYIGWREHWKQFLILGGINAALPFALISAAEIHLTASFGAILNATTPLFTAVVAAIWLKDRLTAKKMLGLAFGVVGVTVAVGWSALDLSLLTLLSVGASLAACLCYALGAVYAKVTFKKMSPVTLATGQMLGATVVLSLPTVAGAGLATPEKISVPVILCLLALALLATSFAYLLYFRILTSAGPTAAATVTFLVPIFSIFWGSLFLGEEITIGLIVGFLIILSALFLILSKK